MIIQITDMVCLYYHVITLGHFEQNYSTLYPVLLMLPSTIKVVVGSKSHSAWQVCQIRCWDIPDQHCQWFIFAVPHQQEPEGKQLFFCIAECIGDDYYTLDKWTLQYSICFTVVCCRLQKACVVSHNMADVGILCMFSMGNSSVCDPRYPWLPFHWSIVMFVTLWDLQTVPTNTNKP